MNITGNYTHNAGATYQVEVNAAGQSDKLIVTGTATLNGGTVSVLAESGAYKTSTSYTILTAGSVVGTYANVTSNFAFLTPSLSYDPTNVYLLLTRNSTSFADVAATLNQYAVASGLDRASPTAQGDMSDVINNLLGLSGQGARSAYDQMGGLVHTAIAESAFSAFNRYIGTVNTRMGSFITGGPSLADTGFSMLASRTDVGSDAGNMILAALSNTQMSSKDDDKQQTPPWGFWMRGYGSLGDRKGDDIASKYDYRNGGITFGFDRKIGEKFLLGVSTGYSYTRANMNDLPDSGKVSSYQGSLYGAWSHKAWYANALVAYGYNRYDTTRNIAFGDINRTAHANFGGHGVSGYTEAGYQIKTRVINIIPVASLQAGYLSRDGFTETDAGALNLDVEKDHNSSLVSSLGVRMKKEYKTNAGAITPEFRARWLHEFSGGDYTVNASFAGSPVSTFTVKGDKPNRDSANLGFTLSWETSKNFSLLFAYDANLASDRTEHGASLGVRYTW